MFVFLLACAAFGKFKDEFLFDIYTKIQNHDVEHGVDGPAAATPKQENSRSNGNRPKVQESSVAMSNFTRAYDEEDEAPAPQLPGGLIKRVKSATGDDRHVFKAPAVPTGVSRLGLDKLAKEKREERERASAASQPAKKIKLQVEDEWRDGDSNSQENTGRGEYKRGPSASEKSSTVRVAEAQYRTKRMETPSHPGGVSQEALRRAEERKQRDRNRGGLHDRAQNSRDGGENRDDDRRRDMDRYDRRDSRSSRDRDYDRSRSDDRYRSSERDDRNRRDTRDDRRDDRDRRPTDRRDDRSRDSVTPRRSEMMEPRSQRSNRSEWDATPSRTGRSTDSILHGGLTPRRGKAA